MMLKDNVSKGLRLIFVDFFGLVVGILNGFFLPMVFSIDGYVLFRTFTLYATYATVFSFGLSDGLYLIYGGKNESDTDASKTKAYYFFLIKLQMVVCSIMFILSCLILKDTALVFFSLFIMPLQLINFFRLYYRALGEFDKYSVLQAVLVVFELLNTLAIVFYVKSQSPNLFISIKIMNHVIVAVFLSILFFGRHKLISPAKLKWADCYAIMKPGFLVMMADMVAALIFSLDRWFIKVLFNDLDFAYYSFAVSILNLFLVFIGSVTSIFYSYISKKVDNDVYIRNLKMNVLMVSSFLPVGYFILAEMVKNCLSKYSGALDILWILILMVPFISVINVLYVNLYKASKSIWVYLKRMMTILVVSFVLIAAAFIIFGTATAIAWTTFLTFIIWYFYSSMDFRGVKIDVREIFYLAFLILSLIAVKTAGLNVFLSLTILVIVLIINICVFYKKDVLRIWGVIRNNVHN